MATHSGILACKIPWMEKPGRLIVHGLAKSRTRLSDVTSLGKIEGRRRTGQQRMRWFGWHHQLNGHEFEQILGDSEGQGSLACCSPWDCKE